MSLLTMLAILLLGLSGDLQPNTEVLLGGQGELCELCFSLEVQKDGWIDLSCGAPPAHTEKFKVENDTIIFRRDMAPPLNRTWPFSIDASGNTRVKITDHFAAAISDEGTATLNEFTPSVISMTLEERAKGKSEKITKITLTRKDGNIVIGSEKTKITMTRKDGNIVIGTPDTVFKQIQIPVTIKSFSGTSKR